MQSLTATPQRHDGGPPPLEALLPAAGSMSALCLILLALLFVI